MSGLRNKNKKLFHLDNGEMVVVDIIPVSTYSCQGEILTEYDLRNLQVQVAEGFISNSDVNALQIKDKLGNSVIFREDGTLQNAPYGYSVTSEMTLKVIRLNRERKS